MAALQVQLLRNFFGDFDAQLNKFTGASHRWEATKIWLLDNFQTLLLITCAILFPAFLFIAVVDHWDFDRPQPVGCRKVGRSGSGTQKQGQILNEDDDSSAKASRERTYDISPIKGCVALQLEENEKDRLGTQYDGQFAFAQLVDFRPGKQKSSSEKPEHQWRTVDRDDSPQLAQVEVELWVPDVTHRQYNLEREAIKNGGSLTVSFPFSPGRTLSMQYFDYLYTSLKAKYIRGSWAAQAMVTFEVPFLPTAERMQRKSYSPKESIEIGKTNTNAINLDKELSGDVLVKLKAHLGVSNPLSLFRVDPGKER